jgi:hypothetical protein
MSSFYYDMEEPVELPRWFKITVGLILGIGLPTGIFVMVAAGRAAKPNDLYDARRIDAKYPKAAAQKLGDLETPQIRSREITITEANQQAAQETDSFPATTHDPEPPALPAKSEAGVAVSSGPGNAFVQPEPGGMQRPGQFERLGSPPSQGILHGASGANGGF